MIAEKQDRLLRTAEAAGLLGLSPKTLRHASAPGCGYCIAGLPAPVRIGKSVRWRLSDINALIAGGKPAQPAKRGPGRPRKTKNNEEGK